MKNCVIKGVILTAILWIVSTICVVAMGNIYTAKFKIIYDNYKLNIENETGEIEIIDENVIGDEYIVKIQSVKPGRARLMVDYGDVKETKELYIHDTMVITENNFFGYSTGAEIIPISVSIVALYSLVVLIIKYKKGVNENLYKYKNIAYLGSIILTSNIALGNIISIFHYHGIYETIEKTVNSMLVLSMILFPLAIVNFILVTISNVRLLMKEGKSFRNILGLVWGLTIIAMTFLPGIIYEVLLKSQLFDISNLNGPGPYIFGYVEASVYSIVSYLECILIGTIIVAIKAVKKKIKYNKDYMIILGSQVRKDGTLTPLLRGRVDRALEFRNEQLNNTNKDLIFIPSGGKGENEPISESEAMKNYLLEKGIDEQKILVENKSKDTYENMKFSNELIKTEKPNIAFSTTNYHVFRAGLIATEQGLKVEGVGSKTKSYFWINAFIREFLGTLFFERRRHFLILTVIHISLLSMIIMSFIANNM